MVTDFNLTSELHDKILVIIANGYINNTGGEKIVQEFNKHTGINKLVLNLENSKVVNSIGINVNSSSTGIASVLLLFPIAVILSLLVLPTIYSDPIPMIISSVKPYLISMLGLKIFLISVDLFLRNSSEDFGLR